MATISASRSPSGGTELRCSNFVCGAQCDQRHSGTARFNHDHPLAPAQREASKPDNSCLGHCRTDHPQRLDCDRAIGIEVIRAVEIDEIDVAARHELLQIDHLRAFYVEGLQFLSGEGNELATLVFVTFDDLFFLDLLPSARIVRPQRDPSCCAGLILHFLVVTWVESRRRAVRAISSSHRVRKIVLFFG